MIKNDNSNLRNYSQPKIVQDIALKFTEKGDFVQAHEALNMILNLRTRSMVESKIKKLQDNILTKKRGTV
jgi:hypothetical protein